MRPNNFHWRCLNSERHCVIIRLCFPFAAQHHFQIIHSICGTAPVWLIFMLTTFKVHGPFLSVRRLMDLLLFFLHGMSGKSVLNSSQIRTSTFYNFFVHCCAFKCPSTECKAKGFWCWRTRASFKVSSHEMKQFWETFLRAWPARTRLSLECDAYSECADPLILKKKKWLALSLCIHLSYCIINRIFPNLKIFRFKLMVSIPELESGWKKALTCAAWPK